MEDADLDKRFNYHPPQRPGVAAAHEDMRGACRMMAGVINTLCPEGREKSLAITKLEEAMMWANAAIARNPNDVGK